MARNSEGVTAMKKEGMLITGLKVVGALYIYFSIIKPAIDKPATDTTG